MSTIARTVLREQVKDILLDRIVRGELQPGERLVETRIASELGTSQAPVREALRDLELLRLVESEPFRGARVREFGDAELIEVYPVRAVLEELAAREAAARLGRDVSVLEAGGRGDAHRGAPWRRQRSRSITTSRFHRAIVEAAGNSRPRAVLAVARRRGAHHVSRLRHVRRADRGSSSSTCRSSRRSAPASGRCRRERASARKHVEHVRRASPGAGQRPRLTEPSRVRSASAAVLVALFLASLALRPQIVGVGPLIPDIQEDLDTSHALAGLLGHDPGALHGALRTGRARTSPRGSGRARAMTIGLALIGVFGVLRAIVPSRVARRAAHLAGRDRHGARQRDRADRRPRDGAPTGRPPGPASTRPASRSGPPSSAALAVPLAAVLGGWRGALITFSVVACAIAIAWAILERGGEPHVRPPALIPRLPWRSRTAWLLVAIFASMGSAYYGLNAWLPDAYGERGWSDESAGRAPRRDEPHRHPRVVRRAVALRPVRRAQAVARRHEPLLRDRGDRPRRLPLARLPVGADRRDLAGRHVRARDDPAARSRGAARARGRRSSG